MASKLIDDAFQRHPRPQVPTKAALLKRNLQRTKQITSELKTLRETPWRTLDRQGELVQGKYTWTVCTSEKRLVMVKEVNLEEGQTELDKITKLSDHPHVATIKQVFEFEHALYFQVEYARYTLEEVLNVHNKLEEPHIRAIASSVSQKLVHI